VNEEQIKLSICLFLCSLIFLFSCRTPVVAREGVYYFCRGASEDKKTYYFTELLSGSTTGAILMTKKFKSDLTEKYGLNLIDTKCTFYGRVSEPVSSEFANKLWKKEINLKFSNSKVEYLDWAPD